VRHLVDFQIPITRKRYTREDSARYALSVGLGQDPLDPQQLTFVDFSRPLAVLPTMAIVLGSAGFWLADPRTGVDAGDVLHAEQRVRIVRQLPDSGEVVGKTVVDRVVDLGPGKAALLFTRMQLVDAITGDLIAESESTMHIRGAGGFGGLKGPLNVRPPDPEGEPAQVVTVHTRAEQALWYRLNGDHNAIHADPGVAKRAGFDRPILHGLCTLGIACQSIVRACAGGDPSRITDISARFLAPVFPGESLETQVWDGGAFAVSAIQRGTVVLRGAVAF